MPVGRGYQPADFAPVSQFVPLPLDFMQKQLDSAQKKTDETRAELTKADSDLLITPGLITGDLAKQKNEEYTNELTKLTEKFNQTGTTAILPELTALRKKYSTDPLIKRIKEDAEYKPRILKRDEALANVQGSILKYKDKNGNYIQDTGLGNLEDIYSRLDPEDWIKAHKHIYDEIVPDSEKIGKEGDISYEVDTQGDLRAYRTNKVSGIKELTKSNVTEKLNGIGSDLQSARQNKAALYAAAQQGISVDEYVNSGKYKEDLANNYIGTFKQKEVEEKVEDLSANNDAAQNGENASNTGNLAPIGVPITVNEQGSALTTPDVVTSVITESDNNIAKLSTDVDKLNEAHGLFKMELGKPTTLFPDGQPKKVSLVKQTFNAATGRMEFTANEAAMTPEQKAKYNENRFDYTAKNLNLQDAQIKKANAATYDKEMQKKAGLLDKNGNPSLDPGVLNKLNSKRASIVKNILLEIPSEVFGTMAAAEPLVDGYILNVDGKIVDAKGKEAPISERELILKKWAVNNPDNYKARDVANKLQVMDAGFYEALKVEDPKVAKYWELYQKAGADRLIQSNVFSFDPKQKEQKKALDNLVMTSMGANELVLAFSKTDKELTADQYQKVNEYLNTKSGSEEPLKAGNEGIVGWRYDKNHGVVLDVRVPGVGIGDTDNLIEIRDVKNLENVLGDDAKRLIKFTQFQRASENAFGQPVNISTGEGEPPVSVQEIPFEEGDFKIGHYAYKNKAGQLIRANTISEVIDYTENVENLNILKREYNDPKIVKGKENIVKKYDEINNAYNIQAPPLGK